MMYINPFWAGVLFTILIEMGIITLLVLIGVVAKTRENTSKNERK